MANKQIFISGGGTAKQSSVLDKLFVGSLSKNKKILYIPIAMDEVYLGYEAQYDWIIETLNKISDTFIEIDMCTSLHEITMRRLMSYGAVYIGGGNTYKLLQAVKESKFDDKLLKYYNSGGIIYGGSAGGILFGKLISTVAEENVNSYQGRFGLNLLSDLSVRCHFKNKSELGVFFEKNQDKKVLALTEDSGIIFKDNKIIPVGNGIFIFSKKEDVSLKKPFSLFNKPENILIYSSNELSINETEYEIVERKGIGHPDNLCDSIAEKISIEYSKFCLEKYGIILRHMIDKVSLLGGASRVSFGAGEMTEPIRLLLNARFTKIFNGERIPYRDIVDKVIKKHFNKIFPLLDTSKWIKVVDNVHFNEGPGVVYFNNETRNDRKKFFRCCR